MTGAGLSGERIAVELMNTVWADRHGIHDSLSNLTSAQDWLGGPKLSRAQLADLGQLRDALRRLAAEATADPRPIATSDDIGIPDAVAHLNSAAALAPTWPELEWAGKQSLLHTRSAAQPTPTLIAALAADGIELFAHDAANLRACLAPGCALYFTKTHPRREWCSSSCGNRARVDRHYRKTRRSASS